MGLAAALASSEACGGHCECATRGVNAPAPRAAGGGVPAKAPSSSKEPLPFLQDDWPRALAEARRQKRPIFVDAWAPWCHSCVSMRAFVLTDPALSPLAPDFVWLAVDTEKDENAAFVTKHQNAAWPTLWVIDPESEEVLLRWEGTATADELRVLLSALKRGADDLTVTFVRATHDAARGGTDAAIQGYRAVLERAPVDHPQRARAAEALVSLLSSTKRFDACAETAVAEAPRLLPGTSLAVVLATGLSCAREGKRSADMARLEPVARAAATSADPRMIADDRSALFEELVEAHASAGDARGAKELAAAWAAFLEGEARSAKSAEARAVFDAHRLSAYLALGDPARALPMLTESERDLPTDYNPPARLARALLELRRLDEAHAAVTRACAKVYGPRSLRVFALAADIAKARGDREGERRALAEALERTTKATLNEAQRRLRDTLEKRLAATSR